MLSNHTVSLRFSSIFVLFYLLPNVTNACDSELGCPGISVCHCGLTDQIAIELI